MELELKNLGQTLAIGGFALYAIILLFRIYGAAWAAHFKVPKADISTLHYTAVCLALVYAAGVLLEDWSKNCVEKIYENYSVQSDPVARTASSLLKSENDVRVESLFEVLSSSEDHLTLRPKMLYTELAKIQTHHRGVAPHFETLAALIPADAAGDITVAPKANVLRLRRAVDGIHYDAKNRVYREESYFQELSGILDRINFTRALSFLCLLFAMIYFSFGLAARLPRLKTRFKIEPAQRKRVLIFASLFVIGALLAGAAYRREGLHFNRRVFGYYISLAFSGEAAQVAATPPPRPAPRPAPIPIRL